MSNKGIDFIVKKRLSPIKQANYFSCRILLTNPLGDSLEEIKSNFGLNFSYTECPYSKRGKSSCNYLQCR